MKNYIAYCGLDCETCDARIATINDDNELRKKVAGQWTKMYSSNITPEMINCTGCRIDGVKTPYCESLCEIRQCGMKKGYETCGDCRELDSCKKITMIIDHCAEALHNLKHDK